MAGVSVTARVLTRPSSQAKARIAGLEQVLSSLLKRKADDLVHDMQIYPPESPGTQRQATPRVRGDGTRKGYQRTYILRGGWQATQVRPQGGTLITEISNHAVDVKRRTPKEYASYVQGPVEGANRQTKIMAAKGWTSITTAHRKRGQELAQEVRRELAQVHVTDAQ